MKKISRWLASAVIGVALAWTAGLGNSVVGQTVTTNQLSFTDFLTYMPAWTPYTYVYPGSDQPNPAPAYVSSSYYYLPEDFEYTNRMFQFMIDTTGIDYWFQTYPGVSFGVGFGGPANWNKDLTLFTSTNRSDYLLSFDMRAEGMTNSAIGGEMQWRFSAPDGTLGPADNNPDTLLQVNKGISVGSNWTHFEYTLDTGSIGGGTEDDFAQYLSALNDLRFNVNFHMPSDALGFDSDNAIYLDNVKLSIIVRSNVPPPQPKTEFTIANWDIDTQASKYSYSYPYCEHNYSFPYSQAFEAGQGVDASMGLVARFDTTSLGAQSPAATWAGVGVGYGGPVDLTWFNTTNLAAYKLYFSSRVEGLRDGRTTTGAEMQFQIQAPDDTIQPPDSDTDPDGIIQINFAVNLKTNWQTFGYTFDKGSIGGGSFANFVQYFNKISGFNANYQVTGVAGDYGYDNDNAFVLDNVKLVRLVDGLPTLNVQITDGTANVSWGTWSGVGYAQLQTATSLTGTWSDVSGATNSPVPVPVATGAGPKFFRLKWVPPVQ